MTSSVPTESSTTNTDNISLEDSEFAYIAEGIRIGSNNGVAVDINGSFSDVTVDGEAVGGADGIFALGTDNHFTVGAHGVVWGASVGIVVDGANGEVFNSGTIFGATIALEFEGGAGGAEVHNSGKIIGGRLNPGEGAISFFSDDGEKHLVDNSGLIQSQVGNGFAILSEGDGVERVTNTGTIKGQVSFDLGNDLLDTSHGTVSGLIDMGGGNDTVKGSAGADSIRGGFGNDQLIGNAGNDALRGDAGVDLLTGGTGADRFVFQSGDSGVATAAQDHILDFHHSQADHIDLRLFDANMNVANDQAFKFIGTKAFTHHAGELHYSVSGGNAFVSGDADGNGVADFTIRVDHVTSLVAGDFLL